MQRLVFKKDSFVSGKNQTAPKFWLYRSPKFAILWRFPGTLSLSECSPDGNFLTETVITEIKMVVMKRIESLPRGLLQICTSWLLPLIKFPFRESKRSIGQSSSNLQVLKCRLRHWLKKRSRQFWQSLGLWRKKSYVRFFYHSTHKGFDAELVSENPLLMDVLRVGNGRLRHWWNSFGQISEEKLVYRGWLYVNAILSNFGHRGFF